MDEGHCPPEPKACLKLEVGTIVDQPAVITDTFTLLTIAMTHSNIQKTAVADIVRQFETIPSDVLSDILRPPHLNHRKPRSERREACLKVLGVLLRHLDGPSLRTGTQAPGLGFVALDMKTIVQKTGLGRRRCERAIAQLQTAGFMEAVPPRQRPGLGAKRTKRDKEGS